jgi:hypothetical protein
LAFGVRRLALSAFPAFGVLRLRLVVRNSESFVLRQSFGQHVVGQVGVVGSQILPSPDLPPSLRFGAP